MQPSKHMTVGELKRLIANLPDDIEIFVETECGTLNVPVLEHGEGNFAVLALPSPYDTYWGPGR